MSQLSESIVKFPKKKMLHIHYWISSHFRCPWKLHYSQSAGTVNTMKNEFSWAQKKGEKDLHSSQSSSRAHRPPPDLPQKSWRFIFYFRTRTSLFFAAARRLTVSEKSLFLLLLQRGELFFLTKLSTCTGIFHWTLSAIVSNFPVNFDCDFLWFHKTLGGLHSFF